MNTIRSNRCRISGAPFTIWRLIKPRLAVQPSGNYTTQGISTDLFYAEGRVAYVRHGSFAVEHFIPYAFLSHDLIWILIPADPSFNSRKNDKLPRMEDYFDEYYLLQKTAIEVITENYPKEPIMEDYLGLFPNAAAQQLPETDLRERFLENIQPLLTIANNNGFEYMGKYTF